MVTTRKRPSTPPDGRADAVRRALEKAPPLTAKQIQRLTGLLRTGGAN